MKSLYSLFKDTFDNQLNLEKENAELWYVKIMDESKIKENEQEIAELWYQVIMKGVE
jgi:hypothetical protein